MKNFKLTNNIQLINKGFRKNEFYHYLKTSNLSIIIPKIHNKYIVVSQKRVPINKVNYESGRLTNKITGFYTKNLVKISKPEKGIKVHLLSQKDIFKLILKQKFNNGSHIAMFFYLIRNHENF